MSDQSTVWPILTHYERDTLDEVVFPLSGIGTGAITLGGFHYKKPELSAEP